MVKDPPANAGSRRLRFDAWIKKIRWRRKWQPTAVFLPGESHGQTSLAGYSPWGRKEVDTTERLSMHVVMSRARKWRASAGDRKYTMVLVGVPGYLVGANWIVAIFSLLPAVFLSTKGQQYCQTGQDVPRASPMQRQG